jgi:hypothetical protein
MKIETHWRGVDALWLTLSRPWLLISSGGFILVLLVGALVLPQLPGQLNSDPTSAARWLLEVSASYGALGNLMAALGLFNVQHSLLLQILLAVIGLILFVHLGDLVAAAWRLHRLPTLLTLSAMGEGAPVTMPSPQPLYRLRQASPLGPDRLIAQLYDHLTTRFEQLTVTPAKAIGGDPVADASTIQPSEAPPVVAAHLLATHHAQWANLRPVLMIGLLLALLVVWLIVIWGWEVSPPILGPGDEFRSTPHQLQLTYTVEQQGELVTPTLQVQIGEEVATMRLADPGEVRLQGVEVSSQPGLPALWIQTVDGHTPLARAGQAETVEHLGLLFPGPGSEESLVLPDQAVGVRIVRMTDPLEEAKQPAFLVEVYEGDDSQPRQRVQIGEQPTAVISTTDRVALHFSLLPAVGVTVRYLPGRWLLWLALGMVLIGAVGFWFRPVFVLVQVAPWPERRSVVVVQSDQRVEVSLVQQWLQSISQEPAT